MPTPIKLFPVPISAPNESGALVVVRPDQQNDPIDPSHLKSCHAVWDPKRNALALAVVPSNINHNKKQFKQHNRRLLTSVSDQSIYLINQLDFKPSRRSLITRSYEIFSSLQKVVQVCGEEEGILYSEAQNLLNKSTIPSTSQLQYYYRIGNQYIVALKDYLVELEKDEDKNADEIDLVIQMIEAFSLFVLVHVPSDGRGDGIVAEQILDWVNRSNPQPPKEEGEELSSLDVPYQHVNFWPYIHACAIRGHLTPATALLKSYTRTHNPTLNQLMIVTIALIKTAPRSTKFDQEYEFNQAVEKFRESIERLLVRLEPEMNVIFQNESNRTDHQDCFDEDDLIHFQASFKILLEILSGDQERISEACYDWREALGAHLLWAEPLSKRDDLPMLMKKVTRDWPIDETSPLDKLTSSILYGDIDTVIQVAAKMDRWFICHLVDLIDKLGISITGQPRSFYIFEFVDYLSVDQGLWRLMIAYLETVVEGSQDWIRKIIRRLVIEDLSIDQHHQDQSMEIDSKPSRVTAKVSMAELKTVCEEQGMEEELMRNARILSRKLMKQRRYGAAIAYAVTSGDLKMVSRISDCLLDEYLTNGPEEFARLVDQIPNSLLHPTAPSMRPKLFFERNEKRKEEQKNSTIEFKEVVIEEEEEEEEGEAERMGILKNNMNSMKLIFLSRYRDMHSFYSRGEKKKSSEILIELLKCEIAPKSWWVICLIDVIPLLEDEEMLIGLTDTYELLRCLEEIIGPISIQRKNKQNYKEIHQEKEEVKEVKDYQPNLRYLKKIINNRCDDFEIKNKLNGLSVNNNNNNNNNNGYDDDDDDEGVLNQLNVVRFALSRHLARCLSNKH